VVHSEIAVDSQSTLDSQLINAIKDSEVLLVRQAIKLEADPNKYDDNGFRPLAYAIQKGNIEIIEILLKAGAKTQELDVRANSALHLAILLDKKKVLYYFLSLKPDTNILNSQGFTPLEYAIEESSK